MDSSQLIVPDTEIFVPGTVHPEADYLEMQRLGKKLGIPVPMLFVELESRSPDGEIIGHYKDRARTFNRNFWNALFSYCSFAADSSGTFGAGVLSVKDTSGTTNIIGGSTTRTYNTAVQPFTLTAAVGIATAGIVVGTGSTAESFENNTLVTRVVQGTASGQLSYQAMTGPTPTYNAGTKVWTSVITRILNNNSGGTIVIAETGLYASILSNTGGAASICMIERSLLGGTVSVVNTGQLTVTYTMTLTFPA